MQITDYVHIYGSSGLNAFRPLSAGVVAVEPNPTVSAWNWDPTKMVMQPFFVGTEGLTITQLTLMVKSFSGYTSGGIARLAIYDCAPVEEHDVFPRFLVKDFGVTSMPANTGQMSTVATGPAITLTNGLYWIASVRSAASITTFGVYYKTDMPTNGFGPNILGGIPFNLGVGNGRNSILADLTTVRSVTTAFPDYAPGYLVPTMGNGQFYAPAVGFVSATGDPYFDNVSLLLPMQGEHVASNFVDVSKYAHTLTKYGNPVFITTASPPLFPSTTVYYASSSYDSHLTAPDAECFNFGSGDFTLEGWFLYGAVAYTYPTMFYQGNVSGTDFSVLFLSVYNAAYVYLYYTTDGSTWIEAVAFPFSTDTQWHHWAVSRNGADLRMFKDGVQAGSTHNIGTASIYNSTSPMSIGQWAQVPTTSIMNQMKDVRITKGVGRYTTTFAVATKPLIWY